MPQISREQGSSYIPYLLYTGTSRCNCSLLALGIFNDTTGGIPGLTGIDSNYGAITSLGLAKDIDRNNGYSDWNIDR